MSQNNNAPEVNDHSAEAGIANPVNIAALQSEGNNIARPLASDQNTATGILPPLSIVDSAATSGQPRTAEQLWQSFAGDGKTPRSIDDYKASVQSMTPEEIPNFVKAYADQTSPQLAQTNLDHLLNLGAFPESTEDDWTQSIIDLDPTILASGVQGGSPELASIAKADLGVTIESAANPAGQIQDSFWNAVNNPDAEAAFLNRFTDPAEQTDARNTLEKVKEMSPSDQTELKTSLESNLSFSELADSVDDYQDGVEWGRGAAGMMAGIAAIGAIGVAATYIEQLKEGTQAKSTVPFYQSQ